MKSTLCLILLFPLFLFAQNEIKGLVIEQNSKSQRIPLPGANVFWLNTTVGAMTSDDGSFKLPYDVAYKKLIISYIGFRTDTLLIKTPKSIFHVLKSSDDLGDVTISARRKSTATSYLSSQNISTISSMELLKARRRQAFQLV